MTLEKPIYKQDWGHQNVSPGDLEERELDPGQLSGIPRLYDLGLRESFSAMCMGKQKKSLCRKRKNDAVSLESEVNCLSFTERWRIWLSVFHFLFPISIPGEWGWILWIIHCVLLIPYKSPLLKAMGFSYQRIPITKGSLLYHRTAV